jgi:hypothetical protein
MNNRSPWFFSLDGCLYHVAPYLEITKHSLWAKNKACWFRVDNFYIVKCCCLVSSQRIVCYLSVADCYRQLRQLLLEVLWLQIYIAYKLSAVYYPSIPFPYCGRIAHSNICWALIHNFLAIQYANLMPSKWHFVI